MFAKFNHPRQYHHQIHLPEQEQEQEEESQASPNSKSGGVDGVRSVPKKPKPDPDNTSDCFGGGGSIEEEAGKRPRGRPPGSKNKPKHPPLFGEAAAECAMRPVFLELPVGLDVIDAIARFTHRRNLGLTVLSASGSVTNVSFRQPSTGGSGGVGIVKFHGRFEILSISATFLPPSLPVTSAPPTPLPSSFTISLVGPQGQIIGGSVAGSLITSSTVYIVAASFDNPTYHRLPIEVMVDQQKHQHEESSSNPFKANNVETSSDQDLIWSPSSPPF